MKNLCSGTQCGGFQFLLILDLWGISVKAVIVFGLGKDFLFKSTLGHCVRLVFHYINLPCHGNFKTSRNSLQKSNDFRGVRFPLYQFFHYSLEIQIFVLNIKSGNSLEIRYIFSCENLLHLHLFFIFFRDIPLCLFNEGSNFITYTMG